MVGPGKEKKKTEVKGFVELTLLHYEVNGLGPDDTLAPVTGTNYFRDVFIRRTFTTVLGSMAVHCGNLLFFTYKTRVGH